MDILKKLAAFRKELTDEYSEEDIEKALRNLMGSARDDAAKRGNVAKEEADDGSDVTLTVAAVQELIRDALEGHAAQTTEKAAATEARLVEAEANIDLAATVLKSLTERVDGLYGDAPAAGTSVAQPPADAAPQTEKVARDGLAALAAAMLHGEG